MAKTITLEECLTLLDRTPYQPVDWYKAHGRRPPKDGRTSATANQWAVDETAALLAQVARNEALLRRWVARGDGIAVYRNEALDSANCGHRQFLSYGSKAAQLETDTPPNRMPDIGMRINWAYLLEAVVPPVKEPPPC